ncbi:MAG TPA: TetR/AcrR family transcriptional regulator [Acetobacteraceae bacterium]|nr:TetR/AcrR family transcriptional regulator [Acetobacteraceae bacterium]
MRYSETHKAETHAKLVKLAGRVLREKGPDKLAVAELMAAAGLTHGGFYAHFKSKDALLAEALQGVFEESRQKRRAVADVLPPREALVRYIDLYLSPAHRDRPATGCPVVALNSDLPRQSRRFRAAFDAGVTMLVADLDDWFKAAGIADGDGLAASVLAAMAGAVAVSRGIVDKRLSDALLAATRDSIKTRLGLLDISDSGTSKH